MNENVLEISKENTYIHLHRGFIIAEENKIEIGRITLDELAILLITNQNNIVSFKLLEELAERNISIVICGKNYLPISIMQPLNNHTLQKARLDMQIQVKELLKSKLWQNIIGHKIHNQAQVLKYFSLDYIYLENLSKNVLPYDKDNFEAIASQRYFNLMFGGSFYRNDENNIINSMLNYGYAIIRGAVARSPCASGLHPSLGIFHKNQFNVYCLVDDMMEPFRPYIDLIVKLISKEHQSKELTAEIKRKLVKVLNIEINYNNKYASLANALIKFSQSLVSSYQENKDLLVFPEFYTGAINDIVGV